MTEPSIETSAAGRPWLVLVESNTTGTGRDFAEAAVRRGLRPVLLTRDPRRYPYVAELGLPVRVVDTGDLAEVEAACRALDPPGPAGILSSSEYFVPAAARVAARLGLPAQDPAAIERCRDKAAQRRCLRAAGVPVPDFVACDTAAAAEHAAHRLGGPVVVKPVSGSGSAGVRRCANPGAARWWATRILTDGRSFPAARLLVEREVPGPEFSVEILDGKPAGVTRKHVGEPPYFVETGHDHPAPLPAGEIVALHEVAARAVQAVGHSVGPAHVELRVPPGGEPTVIEINPRLAGGLIPRLVRHATGRDLVDEVVAGAVALPVPGSPPAGRFASIRFLVPPRRGLVAGVAGLARARAVPGVVEAHCPLAPGAVIAFEHSFEDRKGHVIAVASSPEAAAALAGRALAEIRIGYADERAGAPAR
ncbi:ATP-grasp domain-containing protein [Amycolatopsis sp. NPDC005003]